MQARELDAQAARLATQTGLIRYRHHEGDAVEGTYRQRLNLASGRFAMIDDGLGFSLVPWTPQLDRQLGRSVSGLVRSSGGIDWTLGRNRGLSR